MKTWIIILLLTLVPRLAWAQMGPTPDEQISAINLPNCLGVRITAWHSGPQPDEIAKLNLICQQVKALWKPFLLSKGFKINLPVRANYQMVLLPINDRPRGLNDSDRFPRRKVYPGQWYAGYTNYTFRMVFIPSELTPEDYSTWSHELFHLWSERAGLLAALGNSSARDEEMAYAFEKVWRRMFGSQFGISN